MVKSSGASAGATRWLPLEHYGKTQMLRSQLRGWSVAGSLLLAVILTCSAFAVDQGTTQPPAVRHKARKKPTPALVLPPLPPGPLAQVPMDQLPAAPPKVLYNNGQLSIAAQNATLGDILREVHKVTGATIDVPPAGANERVVVALGPGSPRSVLATLLNGTSFNYVMLGSPSDPAAVSEVMLTSRPSGAGGTFQTAVNNPPVPQTPTPFEQMQQQQFVPGRALPAFRNRQPGANPQPAAADDDSADDSDDSADDKDDDADQAQPQPAPPGGMVQPNLQPQMATAVTRAISLTAGPRTPEQILQMIRNGQRPPGAMPQPQQPPQD